MSRKNDALVYNLHQSLQKSDETALFNVDIIKNDNDGDDVLSSIQSITVINDNEDGTNFSPIAGVLPPKHSSSSTVSPSTSLILEPKRKKVTFSDGPENIEGSQPITSLTTLSTPLSTSIRRLHNESVYSRFIEFVERGRPMRRFIREGLFNWRRRLLSKKKEVVVHLFSDVICLSAKNPDGYLFLIQKFKLKDCRVEQEGQV